MAIDQVKQWLRGIKWIIQRIASFFKRRRFRNELWKPILKKINTLLAHIYSSEALDPEPIVEMKEGVGGITILSKRVIFYVSEHEVNALELSQDTLHRLVAVVREKRTASIRNHLPLHLRNATDYVSAIQILWELYGSLTLNLEPAYKAENEETCTAIAQVEDMLYAGELDDFFREVKEQYGGLKPDTRTQEQIRERFEQKYRKLQKKNRGLLLEASKRQLSYLERGLRGVIAPAYRDFPKTPKDWHIFFWNHGEIVAMAGIRAFFTGTFNELWRKYNRNYLRIEGMNTADARKIQEDWAKGVGARAKLRPRKPRLDASGMPMILILIVDYRALQYPIPEKEIRTLINRSLDSFAIITQEQARRLIARAT